MKEKQAKEEQERLLRENKNQKERQRVVNLPKMEDLKKEFNENDLEWAMEQIKIIENDDKTKRQ